PPGPLRIVGDSGVDQLRQARSALHRSVVDECQLRNGAHLESMRELAPQKTRGVLQAVGRFDYLRLVTEQRKEDLRQLVVGRNFHVRNGDQAGPRVFELEPDDIRELALHLLCDAATAGIVFRHYASKDEGWKDEG